MSPLFLILSVSSLIHITTCTIYNVTPDGTTCHHYCHNLQHYLLNTTKYFTSNTQLLFLPGLHHLHANLIIQNAHNFSLIGSTTNGTTPDTVIQCDSSVGIVMSNITLLAMKSITLQKCSYNYNSLKVAILVKECSFVNLSFIYIKQPNMWLKIFLVGVNIQGHSYFDYITCYAINLYFYESDLTTFFNHTISINRFFLTYNSGSDYGVYLSMRQKSYRITVHISNITVHHLKRFSFLLATSVNKGNFSNVMMTDCQFKGTLHRTWHKFKPQLIKFCYFINVNVYLSNCRFFNNTFKGVVTANNSMVFIVDHCIFYNNLVSVLGWNDQGLITTKNVVNLTIKHCQFYNNGGEAIFINPPIGDFYSQKLITTAIIQNTTFFAAFVPSFPFNVIDVSNTILSFVGPVVFSATTSVNESDGSIIEITNSYLTVYHYVEFSHNTLFSLVTYHCTIDKCFILNVADNAIINITNNAIETYFSVELKTPLRPELYYPLCFFQYSKTRPSDNRTSTKKFSVMFRNNNHKNLTIHFKFSIQNMFKNFILRSYIHYMSITHCYWLQQSAFSNTIDMPLDVNMQLMHYTNNSKFLSQEKTLCYCTNQTYYDCFRDELGPIYPGQTLTVPLLAHLNFIFNAEIITEVRNETYIASCIVTKASDTIQRIGKNCTDTYYTIAFPTDKWCELFLKVPQDRSMEYSIFYIRQLKCPLGFIKIDGTCQCYPMLTMFGFTKCDINTQAILRPPNGWIYLLYNKSHSYYVSQQCPLSYCISSPTYVNLSSPDLQCQFNRTGPLCGHCQQGFSTIFGSNECQHCSNVYLLLLVVFAIAGVLVVVLLFLLHVSVTDGLINTYILYFNIVGVNISLLCPNYNMIASVCKIIISFVNLNLGIKTCFYNGMDDYTKVWLQMLFPSYLILLTIALIITNLYSTTVRRLTARQGLSVLSTLFVLSYMKSISTISSVLFSYSSITHIPSNKTTHVWSVDASVPLLGVRFIILFVICLILLVLMLLMNLLLLFSQVLLKFIRIVNFKPLLDAYQRPYKTKFCYWTGLQLVILYVAWLCSLVFFNYFHLFHRCFIMFSNLNFTAHRKMM